MWLRTLLILALVAVGVAMSATSFADEDTLFRRGDANGDGSIAISDVLLILTHVYMDRQALAAPFPSCGPQQGTDLDLGCGSYPG